MSRGGSRPNAGRKSKSRELLIERSRNVAAQASITPLEYLLQIVQDTAAPDNRRFAAAVAAAPYVHPRLAAVAHSGDQDKPVTFQIITGVPRAESQLNLRSAGTVTSDDDNRKDLPGASPRAWRVL
jgi:hypothetical protein